MNLTCPCCAARFSIEAALTDDAARVAVAAALRLPAPLGDLILRYLALFRPDKRALSWDRAARLLTELLEPIHAAQLERNGRVWPAPLEAWRMALEQMLDKRDTLTLPLKSHGYLFEIVAGAASRAEGGAERKREQAAQRRDGARNTAPQKAAQVVDKAQRAATAASAAQRMRDKIK